MRRSFVLLGLILLGICFQFIAEAKDQPEINDCKAQISELAPTKVWRMIDEASKRGPRGGKNAFARVQAAIRQFGFDSIALNDEIIKAHHDGYSLIVPTGGIQDQDATGMCWMYAGLNMLSTELAIQSGFRIEELGRLWKAVDGGFDPGEFQFSYGYLIFFEKLEKANRYLEEVIRRLFTNEKGFHLRQHLDPMKMVDDGAWFGDFLHLVRKYGVVPMKDMPYTASSLDSGRMIREIADRVALGAAEIRKEVTRWKRTRKDLRLKEADLKVVLRSIKSKYIEDVIEILKTHLGTPPSQFEVRRWDEQSDRYRKGNEDLPSGFERRFETETYTPVEFAQKVLKFDQTNYVLVSDNPLRKDGKAYLVQPSSATDEQPIFPMRVLNLDSRRRQELVVKALKAGRSVWFSMDIDRDVDIKSGIMHPDIFDYDGIYHFKGRDRPANALHALSHKEAMWLFRSKPTHAMLINAVDLNAEGKVVKFGVENSWGDETGDMGRLHMYPEWFERHGYEIVVPFSLLSQREQRLWTDEPTKVSRDDWYY